MRFRHPGIKYRWTSDYSALNRLGYRVVHQHVCKGTGKDVHLAKAGCCANYGVANRSKGYVIENVFCIEEPVGAERAEGLAKGVRPPRGFSTNQAYSVLQNNV